MTTATEPSASWPSVRDAATPQRRWCWLVVLVLLPLAAFHIATLGWIPYFNDEIATVYVLRASLAELIADRVRAGHGPLYFLIGWVWEKLTGYGPVATRSLPLLAGFAAVGILHVLLRRHVGRGVALLTAALALMNVGVFIVFHYARPYTLASLLLMVAAWLAWEGGERPTWRQLAGLALAVAAAMFTHNSAALVLLGIFLFLVVRKRPWWRPAVAVAAGFALWLPYFFFLLSQVTLKSRLGWLRPASWNQFPAEIMGFSFNLTLNPVFDRGGVFLVAVTAIWAIHLLVVLWGFRQLGPIGRLFVWMWGVPLLATAASIAIFRSDASHVARYFTVPILLQLAALAAAVIRTPIGPQALRNAAAVVLALGVGVCFARDMAKPIPRYESRVAEYIVEHMPDVRVVYVTQHSRLRYGLEMYTGREVHMLTNVFGLAPAYDNQLVGAGPTLVGVRMDPPPHAGEAEIVVIETEVDRMVDESPFAPTQEIVDAMDGVIAEYEHDDVTKLDGHVIHHLRRSGESEQVSP